MQPARHHTFSQTAHILDSTSHTALHRPSSPMHTSMSSSNLRSPTLSHRTPVSSTSTSSAPKRRSQNMHLQGLPKYHPLNFHPTSSAPRSTDSTTPTGMTPSTPLDGPHPPMTPREKNQRYTEAQRLFHYQRDLLTQLGHGPSQAGSSTSSPVAPSLPPVMSPGDIMTPLELAEQESMSGGGYLMARPAVSERVRQVGRERSLEEIIDREARR